MVAPAGLSLMVQAPGWDLQVPLKPGYQLSPCTHPPACVSSASENPQSDPNPGCRSGCHWAQSLPSPTCCSFALCRRVLGTHGDAEAGVSPRDGDSDVEAKCGLFFAFFF